MNSQRMTLRKDGPCWVLRRTFDGYTVGESVFLNWQDAVDHIRWQSQLASLLSPPPSGMGVTR